MPWNLVPAGGILTPPVLTYIGRVSGTSDATSYTFSGTSIGTAASDRLVIACPKSTAGSASRELSSVTIDGNSMTEIVKAMSSGGSPATTGIYQLVFPSGTTAEFIVNFTASVQQCCLDIYTLTGYQSSTPTDFDSGSSSGATTISLTGGLDILQGGCALASTATRAQTTVSSWTGLTVDSNAQVETRGMSTASSQDMAAETARTISATWGTSGSTSIVGASWR